MSRAERLLDLLQILRLYRRPVSGNTLAQRMGVSIRTLYRDIASLQAQGAEIEGEPGVGYVLKPGFTLPPLMFPAEEVEALVLGMRWVASRTDDALADSARSALSRISSVLPPVLRHELEASALLIGMSWGTPQEAVPADLLREAIRSEHKLSLAYQDRAGAVSQRIVWPFALAYFDQSRVLICWYELRRTFRHFRTDRIAGAEWLDNRCPWSAASLASSSLAVSSCCSPHAGSPSGECADAAFGQRRNPCGEFLTIVRDSSSSFLATLVAPLRAQKHDCRPENQPTSSRSRYWMVAPGKGNLQHKGAISFRNSWG